MGIGDDIKASVADVRDMLGVESTLRVNGAEVSLGKCSYHDLDSAQARELVGDAYLDEIGTRWALIAVPTDRKPPENGLITCATTGQSWVVKRVTDAQAAGVLIEYRCLCVGKTAG